MCDIEETKNILVKYYDERRRAWKKVLKDANEAERYAYDDIRKLRCDPYAIEEKKLDVEIKKIFLEYIRRR